MERIRENRVSFRSAPALPRLSFGTKPRRVERMRYTWWKKEKKTNGGMGHVEIVLPYPATTCDPAVNPPSRIPSFLPSFLTRFFLLCFVSLLVLPLSPLLLPAACCCFFFCFLLGSIDKEQPYHFASPFRRPTRPTLFLFLPPPPLLLRSLIPFFLLPFFLLSLNFLNFEIGI